MPELWVLITALCVFLCVLILQTLIIISFWNPDALLPAYNAVPVSENLKHFASCADYFAFSFGYFSGVKVGSFELMSLKRIIFQNRISLTVGNLGVSCIAVGVIEAFYRKGLVIAGIVLVAIAISAIIVKAIFFEYSFQFNPTEGLDARDFTPAKNFKHKIPIADEEKEEQLQYFVEVYIEEAVTQTETAAGVPIDVLKPPANEHSVLIVGAGPVGLMTAIQICLRSPAAKVLIIEKHATYQRNHTLFVHWSAYINAFTRDAAFNSLMQACIGKVKIAQLEQRLLTFIQTHALLKDAISVAYCEFAPNNVSDVLHAHPHAKFIIGADGSRSTVRKLFMEDALSIDEVCRHTALVKYDSKCATPKAKLGVRERKEIFPQIGMFVAESRNGDATTLQFFVKEADAAAIEGANFKSAIDVRSLPSNGAQAKLFSAIQKYLEFRHSKLGETVISEKILLVHVPLKIYASKFCVRIHKQSMRSYFLVGDAFAGVPFFRAIHAGFLCAGELARNIAETIAALSDARTQSPEAQFAKLQSLARKYSYYANLLVRKERSVAIAKNAVLSAVASVFESKPCCG